LLRIRYYRKIDLSICLPPDGAILIRPVGAIPRSNTLGTDQALLNKVHEAIDRTAKGEVLDEKETER